ncbi:hypothetical protein [Cetobacterium sp.]|uniref:hypothetical protein n=1 Tax=Cetobacterium sp. TaxID=2071632 RepID=UPI003F4080E3
MKLSKIQVGIANYIQAEIAEKATGIKKFTVYAGTFLILAKIEEITNGLMENPIVQQLGIINSEGDVDIDILENVMHKSMEKTGKVEFMGIIFNDNDVTSLFQHIRSLEV